MAGEFRSDIEAIDVHLMIGSYCVFRITSQHTFGYLFGQPISDPAMREHLRARFGEIVVSWLTDTAAHA